MLVKVLLLLGQTKCFRSASTGCHWLRTAWKLFLFALTRNVGTVVDEVTDGATGVITDTIMKVERGIKYRPPVRVELRGSVGGDDS